MKFKLLVYGLIVGLLVAMNFSATNAASVAPVFVPGNPTCTGLGYDAGFKVDPPNSGTYNIDAVNTVTVTSDGTFFSWTSTLGMDAVIAKGGPNANLYIYDPPAESFGDTQLASPINPNTNQPFGLSHIEFCYDLEVQVTKTAITSFDREWDWTIDKVCDETTLILSPGQTIGVDCDVTVGAASTDSGWAVEGEITIHNPAPATSATVTDVSDVISGVGAVDVDCGAAFPIIVGAGQDLVCTYSSDLPDGSNRTNTATVTTSGTIGGGSGQAAVTFGGAPTTETDECIDVDDDQFGTVGTRCAADGLPHTFTYTQTIGPFTSPDQCGENLFVNVATFTTNDTQTTGSDDHTITVTVPCVLGCTLTQGYWKTHSLFGPAPYDNTWALLINDENTPFFGSGKTWYQAFWTPPAGNPYYQLAHQYMAAALNILNGADTTPAVDAAMTAAETLFTNSAYDTPTEVANLKGKNAAAVRQLFTNLAGILGSYNEGLIGPGHCSE